MSYSLYCIKGPFTGQEIPIADVLIIGRDPSAVNLVIEDAAVSRAHVKLYPTQEGLVLEDLNSSNGTFLCLETGEMREVNGALVLHSGNRFSVGNNAQYIFELRSESSQQTAVSMPDAPQTIRARDASPVAQAPHADAFQPAVSPAVPQQKARSAANCADEDIFQTTTKIEITEDILATRGSRFSAYIIDELIFLAIFMLSFYVTGSTVAIVQLILMIFVGPIAFILNVAAAYIIFLGVNCYFLNKTGQTIGKKVMRIYIADLNGRKAQLAPILGMRMALMFLLTMIPFVGWIIGLANICFIFKEDRRMLHDLLASTVVLQCKNANTGV